MMLLNNSFVGQRTSESSLVKQLIMADSFSSILSLSFKFGLQMISGYYFLNFLVSMFYFITLLIKSCEIIKGKKKHLINKLPKTRRLISKLIDIFFTLSSELKWLKNYPLLIPLIIWSLLFTEFIVTAFNRVDYEKNSMAIIIYIIITTRILWCISKGIIKSQPIFQLENYASSAAIILSILGILTLIFNTDLKNYTYWTWLAIFLTISSVIFDTEVENMRNKNYQKAQKIFQEQLLLENPDYKELKKCYYHGGKMYKEKLLSTEKFLRVIIEIEGDEAD